jgi:hypothetical protein
MCCAMGMRFPCSPLFREANVFANPAVSLTACSSKVGPTQGLSNCFKSLRVLCKTVETLLESRFTPLQRGINERKLGDRVSDCFA